MTTGMNECWPMNWREWLWRIASKHSHEGCVRISEDSSEDLPSVSGSAGGDERAGGGTRVAAARPNGSCNTTSILLSEGSPVCVHACVIE